MERVGILIDKLKDQFAQKADSDKLLVTAQMLLAELQQHKKPNLTKKKEELSGWLFDMHTKLPIVESEFEESNEIEINEMSSVNQDSPVKEILELNDFILEDAPSIHDRLKQNEVDVSAGFQETPIRDLKKAIGINDRYLFINELFRGDETMYERSLKTINSFAIFPEAQYWIQRELKVKLGWNDRSETVDHFHQLVRRRFA
ncbi:MAG: hypothetical protein WCH78_10925 [Bacteroidota bacterium]